MARLRWHYRTTRAASIVAVAVLLGALDTACDNTPQPVACAPHEAFPTPRFVEEDGISAVVRTVCVDSADLGLDVVVSATLDRAVAALVAESGLSAGKDCAWQIKLTEDAFQLSPAANEAWSSTPPSQRWAAETVVVDDTHAASTVRLTDAESAIDALRVLLANGTRVSEGTIVDGAAFSARGVIESAYAAPFSNDDRLTTLAVLGSVRGNFYVYGPKGDPFANARWADPYDSTLGAIVEAAAKADANFIEFYWAVSPGWREPTLAASSIQYSSDVDFARLVAKVEQLRAAGVSHFALFLDDIQTDFAWDGDKEAFGSLAAAHAFLANRLEAYVAANMNTHLWFVGTYYSSGNDNWLDYDTALGNLLDPAITVLWTGSDVYSRTMTAADLVPVDTALHRDVAIWDNAPFHVLPLSGRSVDLATAASGYLSNAVLAESGVPIADYWAVLGTVADFAWDPERYSPTTSITAWARARPCLLAPAR